MKWADVRLRLRAILFRERMDRDLQEELAGHLELETRKYLAAGLDLEEAQRRARLGFGGLEQVKEECRDKRRVGWFTDLLQDAGYALRTFRRAPGFTTIIVLMLAVGIGANTAIFGIVDAVLLKMLPVRDPGALFRTVNASSDSGNEVSYRMFGEMRSRVKPYADLMAYQLPQKTAVFIGRSEEQYLEHQAVSGSFFSVLGVQAALGRLINAEDEKEPGQHAIAVISSDFWDNRFHRSSHVLGEKLRLGNRVFTIVGVAPPQFFGVEVGAIVDVWTPVSMAPAAELNDEHLAWLQIMGRRKPGVSLAQAVAPLQAVWEAALLEDVRLHAPPGTPRQVIERFLAGSKLKGASAGGGISYLREQYKRPLQIVMFVVAMVLLIACTNVANLMIARGSSRQREMAVRLSLGAGRLRLLRQLMTESALVALLSGVFGLLISRWATPLVIRSLAPGNSPVELAVKTDARVLGFTAAVVLLTVLIFGLFPALRLSKADIHSALKSGTRLTTGGAGRAGRMLVIAQFALSFVLLVGSILFTRTLWNLMSSDMGFDPHNVVVADLAYGNAQPPEKRYPLWAELLREVKQLPGVQACSLSSSALFSGSPRMLGVRVTDPASRPADPISDLLAVSSDYFQSMGIRVKAGRSLNARDDSSSSPRVAVVNEAFEHKFFGTIDPLGKKMTKLADAPEWVEIVGVVQNAKFNNMRQAAPPMFYVPYERMTDWFPPQMHPGYTLSLQVRGRQSAASLAATLRRQFGNAFAVRQIAPQDKLIDNTLTAEKLLAGVSNLFGGLALVLTALGLYGIMSYAVARRRQEIGIRMALGATPNRVLSLMLGDSVVILLIGLLIGLPIALASTRAVRSLLYGLTPNGWTTFAVAGAVLLTASLLAAFIPAYKAAKTDPAIALRYE